MDFYLTTTYTTGGFPQINLQNLKPVSPAPRDSTLQISIPRTHFNIINIDTIAPVVARKPVVATPVIKIAPQPVISLSDSLKFNLKGKKGVFTNWNLSPERDVHLFDKTLYSQIDEELLQVSRINADSLNAINNASNDSIQKSRQEFSERSGFKSESPGINKNPLQDNNVFLSLILVSVLITGFVRVSWKEYLVNVLRSIFFQDVASKISANNASYIYPSFILGFLFFLNGSIFVFEIFKLGGYAFMDIDSRLIFPLIFSSIFVLYYSKILFLRFTGHIFDVSQQMKSYLQGFSSIGKAFAIVILPVIILIPFANETVQSLLINIGSFVFIALYLLQISHGIKIILKETFSLYYIILYLCALEILPLFILFKVIGICRI